MVRGEGGHTSVCLRGSTSVSSHHSSPFAAAAAAACGQTTFTGLATGGLLSKRGCSSLTYEPTDHLFMQATVTYSQLQLVLWSLEQLHVDC